MTLIEMIWNRKIRGFFNDKTMVYASRRTKDHYCFKYKGWGVQKSIIKRLAELGCKTVRIVYEDTDGTLKPIDTPFSNYITNGREDWLGKYDGLQIFLPAIYFKPKKELPAIRVEEFKLFGW